MQVLSPPGQAPNSFRRHHRSRVVVSSSTNSLSNVSQTEEFGTPGQNNPVFYQPNYAPPGQQSPPTSHSTSELSSALNVPPSATCTPPLRSCLRTSRYGRLEAPASLGDESLRLTTGYHVRFVLPADHQEEHGPCPRTSSWRSHIDEVLYRCRFESGVDPTRPQNSQPFSPTYHKTKCENEMVKDEECHTTQDNGDDNFAEGETNTISFDSQENAKGVIPSSEVREWWEIDSEEDTEFDVFDLDLDNISIFDEEESIEDAEESYENMEYNDDGGDDVEDNTMEER